jgi:hypothetical protein
VLKSRYIENLALLHKSKEEAIIDQLRLHAQSTDEDSSEDSNQPRIPFDVDLGSDDDDIWDLEGNHSTATLAVVQSALEGSLESSDLYVDEAMEANFANGYFELTPDILPSLFDGSNVTDDPSDDQLFTAMDTKLLRRAMKDAAAGEERNARIQDTEDVMPGVFLTGSDISFNPCYLPIIPLSKKQ